MQVGNNLDGPSSNPYTNVGVVWGSILTLPPPYMRLCLHAKQFEN